MMTELGESAWVRIRYERLQVSNEARLLNSNDQTDKFQGGIQFRADA